MDGTDSGHERRHRINVHSESDQTKSAQPVELGMAELVRVLGPWILDLQAPTHRALRIDAHSEFVGWRQLFGSEGHPRVHGVTGYGGLRGHELCAAKDEADGEQAKHRHDAAPVAFQFARDPSLRRKNGCAQDDALERVVILASCISHLLSESLHFA